MGPRLPIKRHRLLTDRLGRSCKIEVCIKQTIDKSEYPPDGKKCVFKVMREKDRGNEDYEIVFLIDNHAPFGFHQHPKLPGDHDIRESIHASTWEEAWNIFDKKMQELLNET